ncbi:MAG: hypothetical protein ACJAVJ_001256 [Planctomycetota bacterium]|jgi:hypothetical protein
MITALFLATLASPVNLETPIAPAALVQEDADETTDEKKPQRAEAWPEISKDLKKELKTEISRLRKASTEGMASGGRDALIKLGAVAAPDLIKALGKERDEAARNRITDVLDAITGWEHTRLLAEHFDDRSEHVRLLALRRAAAFPDEGTRAAAVAALADAEKRVDTKKEIKHEAYYAALAVVSSGDLGGLAILSKRAEKLWAGSGAEIRTAVEAVRGDEATEALAKQLADGKRKQKVAALRLLAGCGSAERGKALARKSLSDSDNSIRVAAINAMRGIVDGDLPIDKLSVFEAVELANEWKGR